MHVSRSGCFAARLFRVRCSGAHAASAAFNWKYWSVALGSNVSVSQRLLCSALALWLFRVGLFRVGAVVHMLLWQHSTENIGLLEAPGSNAGVSWWL